MTRNEEAGEEGKGEEAWRVRKRSEGNECMRRIEQMRVTGYCEGRKVWMGPVVMHEGFGGPDMWIATGST